MKNSAGEYASNFKLHVTNIVDIQHCPITSLDLKKDNSQLALYRGGESPAIEIWNVSNAPFLQRVLYDLENNDGKPSVESLIWIQDRLFSCGLHGFVLEHDVVSKKIKRKYMATSGPVWQISPSPNEQLLAAGTEDGFVNIFQVLDDGLEFVKVLDRQEGRVLCLSWSPCGKFIATGSVDNVRLWDVEKGHAVQRLITGRSKNTETIVWSILLLDNLTIVSGDSRGIVTFWDGNIGVSKYKIVTHKADILALKMSADRSCIYVSGVDPSVVLLAPLGKSEDKWVKSHQRNMHTNDVMCLSTLGHKLISGGRDCDLTISSPPRRGVPKIVTKYPPIPKSSRIFSSKSSRRILIQDPKAINIWQILNDNHQQEELVKLLEIKSSNSQTIHSSCLSPSGESFAYATKNRLNFFNLLTLADGSVTPVKLKKVSNDDLAINLDHLWTMHFLSNTLILAITVDGSYCQLINVDKSTDSVTLGPEILLEEFIEPIGIDIVATHADGKHFAVATSNGYVHIFEITDSSAITLMYTVPHYQCPISALGFHSQLFYLMITFSDHTVEIVNFESSNIVFHERIGGPKIQREVNSNTNSSSLVKQEETKEVVSEDYNENLQPILGTSWSPDGMRAVLYELNKIHLMEFSEESPTEPWGEPASKKSKETTQKRRLGKELQDLKLIESTLQRNSKDTPRKRTRHTSSDSNCSNSTQQASQEYKEEQWISAKLASLRVEKSVSKNINKYSFYVNWKSLDCKDEYLAYVDFLDSNQLISVQVKPSVIFNKLPPAFAKKRFGM